MFEDLVDPLCVEGHVDEDTRLIGSSTASAVDTDSHYDPDISILAYQRPSVVPLRNREHIFLGQC